MASRVVDLGLLSLGVQFSGGSLESCASSAENFFTWLVTRLEPRSHHLKVWGLGCRGFGFKD